MKTDNRCVAEDARSWPENRLSPTTETAFGCVDSFLYDPARRRSQGRALQTDEEGPRRRTASEERQLMGYVH